jgi:ribonuclease T2
MYWGSLNGPADTFWAHEYEKHGTCEEDLFATQHDFFAGALNLLGKYNVTTAVPEWYRSIEFESVFFISV